MKSLLPKISLPFILGFIFIAPALTSSAENIFKKITVLQCDSLINANETNPNFVILDVRTPSQWQSDHLEGSINRNYYDSDFTQQLDALPKYKTYLIHCQSGGRSSGTFTKMQSLGFVEVYDMQGGMSAWKSASLPTTSEIAPKLMLVSEEEIKGISNTDTIKITVTNRANDILTFSSITLYDIHEIYSDFEKTVQLQGAEDYTFFVFHEPGYEGTDSTCILLNSNGGELDIDVVYKNGVIQAIPEQTVADFTVFPNPASEYLQFNIGKTQMIDEILIADITGKIILMRNNFDSSQKLNIEQLQTGIYILRLKAEDKLWTRKIMVAH